MSLSISSSNKGKDNSVSLVQKNEPLKLLKGPSIYSLSSSPDKSLLPYKVIKFMATHDLVPFVTTAMQHLYNRNINMEEALTSCVSNMFALSVIFSGEDKAKFIKNRMEQVFKQEFNLVVNKTRLNICVQNLFAGHVIAIANRKLPNKPISQNFLDKVKHITSEKFVDFMISDFIQDYNNLQEAPNSKLIEKKLVNFFQQSKYDFNESVIRSIRSQMHLNSRKVNEQNSYIYYIGIHFPTNVDANDSDVEMSFFHAFAVEQFNSEKGILYRVYNTWQGAMTLLEYFQKKGYLDDDEGCLTHRQIKKFLLDLHRIIDPTTSSEAKGDLRERCFGFDSLGQPPSVFFDAKKRILKGMSLRFVACKFNPKDTLENFNNFIQGSVKIQPSS